MILSQEQCINDFVRYQKVTQDYRPDGKKGGKTIETLEGIESDKPGYIHQAIDENNKFEDKPTKVPKGYKKVNKPAFIKDIAKDFYCTQKKVVSNKPGNTKKVTKGSKQSTNNTKKSKKLNTNLKGALEFDKWYDNSRKYWLTIKDIETMKNKGKLVVLPMHRNVLDGPQTYHNKENTPYKPETFFKTEKDTFVNYGNMSGVFIIYDQYDKEPKPLDIEYKKDKWYPLFDGYLPDKDIQSGKKLLGKKKHWTEFKKDTHVGFRGPMILWSDLKKLPKLYFKD